MGIPATENGVSSRDRLLSDTLEQQAKMEMIETGKVKVICPKCQTKPEVTITGLYGERVKIRCKCGFLACTEYGI